MGATAGDAWFEGLPAGWDVAPLRFITRFESGGTPDKGNRDFWGGEIPWVSPKDMKVDRIADSQDHITDLALRQTSLSLVPEGSVLLVVRGMILAHSIPVAVSTAPVTINQDMKALRCSDRIDARFLQAVIHGAKPWFVANTGESSHGTKKLETEVIGRFPVPLPPLETQHAIADFLDAATARIDALIDAKENLLAILAEKRGALVTQAVTRGLDPEVPMRDSGIPWLGEIPAHWELLKVRHFARVGNGSTPKRDNSDYWLGGTIPWLNSSVVNQPEVTRAEQRVTEAAVQECHLPLVPPPSILVGITGQGRTRGRASVLRITSTINQHLAFITPRADTMHCEYLQLVFVAAYDFLRNISDGMGGTKGALTCEALGSLRFPCPPLSEQHSLVEQVQCESARLGALEQAARASLGILRERREALIAAAVTGKLDVEPT